MNRPGHAVLKATRIFPIPGIRDYAIFYRAYRGGLIKKAVDFYKDKLFETEGFVGVPELLVKLARFKPSIVELPLVVRYDSKKGASKMKVIRTIKNYLYMAYVLKRQGL